MSEGGPQKGLTEAQILRDFARSRFQRLARKVVWRLTRNDASAYVCGGLPMGSLWDEYCYCVQFGGRHPVGERLLREHVRALIGFAVDDLGDAEERVLWLSFGEDELDTITCRPLVLEAVEDALREIASHRNIDHMLPEWER